MSNPANNSKGKRIVRTTSRAVDNIVLLTLLVILMIAAYSLWDTHQLYASAESGHYTTYKPSEDNSLSFEELRAMNPDVIGWLTVYDTKIDYPVLRSPKTNDDYLSKNALGEWEASGSLFLDHNNRADFSDFNTIIFGHHMSGHNMFGDIDLFSSKDFFDKHEYANLYFSDTGLQMVQSTPSNPSESSSGWYYEFTNFNGRNHGVQFFAMCQVETHDTGIYSVPSQTEEVRNVALDAIARQAIYVRNLQTGETKKLGELGAAQPTKTDSVDSSFFGVSTSDHIVLMSTCSADITNGRLVLVGKILDYEVPNPFPDEEEQESQLSVDLFSVLDKVLKLPIWQWVLILLGLILLIGLLYYAEKKRLKKKQEKKEQK